MIELTLMENIKTNLFPIGVFDSGVGGLSVLRAIRAVLPHEDILYFGDQANVPYGSKSLTEVQRLVEGIVRFLLSQSAKLIVVACNTASAAALHTLRDTYLGTPFVGMEPAVKPAAEHTHSGKVGVLATPATFQGELYASVVERFAIGIEIFQETCPGLVHQIELGHLNTAKTRCILEQALHPMLAHGIDTVVLGCTHYPFVIPVIEAIVSPEVNVIDPAPAVARQVRRLLERDGTLNAQDKKGSLTFYTSGSTAKLQRLLPVLIDESSLVKPLQWVDGNLSL